MAKVIVNAWNAGDDQDKVWIQIHSNNGDSIRHLFITRKEAKKLRKKIKEVLNG